MIGQVFADRYEVVSSLGGNRVAEVYLANDRSLGRQVALKVLAPSLAEDQQFLERFRREASHAAGLDHPNIVRIGHRGQAKGTYFIAMEYLGGRSLQTIIREHAPLGADLLTSISLQMLEALRFAHRRNVVHGDIRPENVFIDSDGQVKVTDFGIARAGQDLPADADSDLHSLGVLMYQMATGRLPFEGHSGATDAEKHGHDRPPALRSLNPRIPSKLEAVITRALGLGPGQRYVSAQEMLDDLWGVQVDEAEAAPHGFAEEAARVMAATAAAPMANGSGAPQIGGAGADLGNGMPGTSLAGMPAEAPPTLLSYRQDEQTPIIEQEEQPGRPRRAWPWVIVTILIVALVATAYVILSNRDATPRPEFATVPGVVGLSEAEAIKKIEAAGFEGRTRGREPSVEVEEGYVLRQDTGGGTKLEKGETIGVWISSGTGQIKVPNVVGLTEAEAAERLSQVGLESVAKPEVGSEAEIGRVLRQNPEADKKVDPGSTVTITVAAVTNTVKVPPLTGLAQESAVALLKGMSLVAEVQETESALPGGMVDYQEPAGGSEVPRGSTVRLFVSNSPPAKTVIVPAVGALGLTATQAKAILAKYGLKAKVIDLETPDSKPGLCIYQDPAAGAEVKIGSVVDITIARKPTTTTTLPPPSGAARYDQTDTHIVKTGAWSNYQAAAAYLGSYGRSNTPGASATIYFSGTRLDWIGMKGTTTGIADVYLDGVKKATINLAATSATYAVNIWSTGNLRRGSHRVTIVLSRSSPAGKYLTLDAVDIWGTIRTAP